ncbi:heparan-alpha-glucosaminide N-acetyltransferase domain-containing protein [Mycetocola zhujimingii]|uniref:heparan-alpha-glucosaminide N-acetyltransferase domain-containing protein n=1 Tax=Mycetocola zhujimingii TaxID=2079792 RepID=UPI000D367BA4|nr:heparan-alpha-glucosaminide N-acetyltransferase domain-containing protein [Mycetocola zhujimingii]AWB86773.1 hypothetical protein C3E77_09175 [Mycetocola zhujimingii]
MSGDVDPDRFGSSRIVGVDIARGLAIIGMFVAHTMPNPGDRELLVDGRSSILFATLAGVSLGILSGQDSPKPRGSRSGVYRRIVIRALSIFLLGVVLTSLGSEIAIILDYYAIMFLVALPVLFLPRIWLGVLLLIFAFAAPLLASIVTDDVSRSPSISEILREYFLTGFYPVLIWLPFVFAGLIAARSGLARPRTQAIMIGCGSGAALAGYGAAAVLQGVTAAAHSGTTAEVFGSGGVALAIIGILVAATTTAPAAARRVVRTVFAPVGAAGAMALSVYTVQILILAIAVQVRDSSGLVDYPGWPLLGGLVIGSLIGSWLWQRYLGKGPLERAIALASGSG